MAQVSLHLLYYLNHQPLNQQNNQNGPEARFSDITLQTRGHISS